MTQEEAIEIVKRLYNNSLFLKKDKEAMLTLVPELVESDDEKIREEMIRYFTEMKKGGSAALPYDDCIAYLERQKEQKPADEAEKFFDSIESYNQGFVAGQKKMKEDIEKGFGISEHSLDYLAGRYAGYAAARQEQKPAEWSEEDNIGWEEAFACVTRTEKAAKNEEKLQNAVTAEKWLKEIKFKYYVHPIKQELSEEDKRAIDRACVALRAYSNGDLPEYLPSELLDYADRLQSLRPRPHWKPSEEQIKALHTAAYIDGMDYYGGLKSKLLSLYDDLKKLM